MGNKTITQQIMAQQWVEAQPGEMAAINPAHDVMVIRAAKRAVSPQTIDTCHYHLARIVGRSMQTLSVKAEYGRLALVEFVPNAVMQLEPAVVDPVVVLPLFRVSEQFDRAMLRLVHIQMRWVRAGGQPDDEAMTQAMKALDTMSAELMTMLAPGEAKFWAGHMRRIVSQPQAYLPIVAAWHWQEWQLAGLFAAVVAVTVGLLMLL